jgi:hypothetical protein
VELQFLDIMTVSTQMKSLRMVVTENTQNLFVLQLVTLRAKIFIVCSLRGIQMNVYIKVINLKDTTCFDPYWVIIMCRLMLRC